MEHHIVTKHTSLVAVDITPTKATDVMSIDKAVPVKKLHGWEMKIPSQAYGQIPQGATSAKLNFLIGILLLLTGLLLRKQCF